MRGSTDTVSVCSTGGKNQLLSELDKLIPTQFNRYFEPFVGAGAMFFHLVSRTNGSGRRLTAYLSDTNTELITTWLVIRDNPKGLIELQGYNNEYKAYPPYSDELENYYYLLRDLYGCWGSVIALLCARKRVTYMI